jgi:pSer/pThr/pTyr-binding forkhead associated (FHA) protein
MMSVLPVTAQASDDRLVLTNIEYDGFPEVSFELRAYVGGRLAEGLETGVSITEDGGFIASPVVERLGDLPVHLTIFIDNNPYSFSRLSNQEILGILGSLQQLGYRDGDTISVYSTAGKQADYTTWAAFSRWIQAGGSIFSGDDLNSLPSVVSALRDVGLQKDAGETVGFLYVVRVVQEGYDSSGKSTAVSSISSEARRVGVAVNVIHADSQTSGYENDLSNLTAQTGGTYVSLVGRTSSPQAAARAGAALSPLFTSRANYRVRYRSSSGTAAARAVEVNAAGQSSAINYTVPLQNPVIVIDAPRNGQVLDRRVTANASVGRNEFSNSSADVRFRVEFPDNYPRALRQVQVVDVSPIAQTSIYALAPGATETVFQTTWDLAAITEAGDNPRTLRVAVTDELGLSSVSEAQVTIPIPVAPPMPTRPPDITVVETPCERDLASGECVVSRVTLFAPYVVALVLLLMVLSLRRQIARIPVVQGAGRAVRQLATQIGTQVGEARRTLVGIFGGDDEEKGNDKNPPPKQPDSNVYAYLEVSNGPDAKMRGRVVGRRIGLVDKVTRIGRDPQQADIEFYGPESSSSVSRSHCAIAIDVGRRVVTISNISENNRLTVNGVRVEPTKSYPLENNAYVELGNLSRNGLSFDFRYAAMLGGGVTLDTQVGSEPSVPTYIGTDPSPEAIRTSAEVPMLDTTSDDGEESERPETQPRFGRRRGSSNDKKSDDWMKKLGS